MANGDETIHLIHTLWSTALTGLIAAFGWLVQWNWAKLSKEVAQKVDKDEMRQLREDLRTRWEQQDRLQTSTTERLDRILERLPSK